MSFLIYFLFKLPCPFHALTGLYCPGCGGTRAVIALLTGHPIKSFLYHPLVLYVALLLVYIAIRKLINKNYHLSGLWLKVAIVIIIVNMIVKNVALLMGYDILIALGNSHF
ncbi:MAG: DUF2752 domain-containing protein [Pseudobutyrivibrio sp.]|nr:DUF2752 domain-containing protein [Pseudobutyrivibrio sp.]